MQRYTEKLEIGTLKHVCVCGWGGLDGGGGGGLGNSLIHPLVHSKEQMYLITPFLLIQHLAPHEHTCPNYSCDDLHTK